MWFYQTGLLLFISCVVSVGIGPPLPVPSVHYVTICGTNAKHIALPYGNTIKPIPFDFPQSAKVRCLENTGRSFDPKKLVVWQGPKKKNIFKPGYDGYQLVIEYEGMEIAMCRYHVNEDSLRFDLEIQPHFQAAGLYEAMLRQALKDYPKVTSIPARMIYERSKNARKVIDAAFGSEAAFKVFDVQKMTSDQLTDLRAGILKGVAAAPMSRSRNEVGFGKLSKIILDPTKSEVALYYEKGNPLPDDSVRVYFAGEKPVEVLPTKKLRPVTNPTELELGNYPEAVIPVEVHFVE